MVKKSSHEQFHPARERLFEIIFEADTRTGKNFDVILLIMIFASVAVVMLETVPSLQLKYGYLFKVLEWIFTVFFTIEYLLRIYCVYKPLKYMKSFYGIIDLLAILPTYLSIFLIGSQQLMIIRALRLLRVFRIFKMVSFLTEASNLIAALKRSRRKILVFLFTILLLVTILGSIMHLIEGGVNESFDSIPRSIYWAIVTLTTVGYGDISPITPLGQMIAAMVMIMGYSVIAVPTGIVSAELIGMERKSINVTTLVCHYCSKEGHTSDAIYCKYCGESLKS
jgi:voltage-gated potassium channel